MKRIVLFLPFLFHFAIFCFAQSPAEYVLQKNGDTIFKKIECTRGAVASASRHASKVGLNILKKGGNAFDAAVSMQFALAVVFPQAGNLGGGGFLVGYTAKGEALSIDYRETAPGKAFRDMYLDSAGNPQMEKSQDGHLSSGVPGTVAGIFATLPYCRLPLKELIDPAIKLAEQGFAISEDFAGDLNRTQELFRKNNTVLPVFVKQKPWKGGELLIQKELAGTLRRIGEQGMKGFYEGETARLIVQEMRRGKGIITLEDLRNYKAKERAPLRFIYKEHEIVSMPLPSSGGIILAQCLGMMRLYDIARLGFHTPASVQLMIEAERRAFADRAEYLGDPDFVKSPVDRLLASDYLLTRMKDYTPGTAGSSALVRPGLQIQESTETTHLSVVDEEGNAVAVTTTINDWFGSKTVVGGAGFLLNDEMDDFSVKPGVANMFGAIGNDANAIAPGKRMLSSMTPTIVLKNKRPFLITGSPGGTTIPTSVLQTIVNVIDFGLSPYEAVARPKFHHQWHPDTVQVESNFPAPVLDSLRQMGYVLQPVGGIGRVELILIDKGKIVAVADPRGEDDARGY